MVTIQGYGTRECIWCQREKEGVEVATEDRSFLGFLCFSDLRRMLRLKGVRGVPPMGEAARPDHPTP